MLIRRAMVSDAECMIELFHKLDSETKFMMKEPGEQKISVEDQAKVINSFSDRPEKLMAVTIVDESIVGFIVAAAGSAKRNRQSGYMVLGI